MKEAELFVQGYQTKPGSSISKFLVETWIQSQPQKKGEGMELLSAHPFPHLPKDPEGEVKALERLEKQF